MKYDDFIESVNEEAVRQANAWNKADSQKSIPSPFVAKPLVFGNSQEMRRCFDNGYSAADTIEEILYTGVRDPYIIK
jgi:hypothetical protein